MTFFLYGEAGLLLMSRLQRSGNNFRLMSAHYMYGLNESDQAKKRETNDTFTGVCLREETVA
jgi:hypothetical protein